MELFRTIVKIPKSELNINYTSKIMMLGSCFAENIGEKLNYYCFQVNLNPFGIIYNPASIAQSIDYIIDNKVFTLSDIYEYQGVWYSLNHHTRFAGTDKNKLLNSINESSQNASEFIKKTDILILTLGTSWVYLHNAENKIVANCNRLPGNMFTRKLLSVSEIVETLNISVDRLLKINPEMKIIFTVSPVRHFKDSAAGNQLSKSQLIIAVHELLKKNSSVFYFPAYEIMMDDLRDYRFYNSDMVHPNDLAVNYIWNNFKSFAIDRTIFSLMNEIELLQKALHHRPFNANTEQYNKFVLSNIEKIESLKKNYSHPDLSELLEEFEKLK